MTSFLPILIILVVLICFLLFLGFIFLLFCLILGYYLLSRKKGKTVAETVKETKPVEAVTAAFQIRKGGLKALLDEDDDDDDEDDDSDEVAFSVNPNAPQGFQAAQPAEGVLDPIDGVSLDDYARISAALGFQPDVSQHGPILAVFNMTTEKWAAVSAGWQARMQTDTSGQVGMGFGQAYAKAQAEGPVTPAAPAASAQPSAEGSLEDRANAGDMHAQNDLAVALWNGDDGYSEDRDAARPWLEKAAAQGHPVSQSMLAECYLYGRHGVPEDPSKAYELYFQSAEKGHPLSMHALAIMNLNGVGVEQNPDKALEFFLKSAEAGFAQAQHDVAELYRTGRLVGEIDLAESARWCEKSAHMGFPPAVFGMGLRYMNGDGVEQSATEACGFYRLGANNGDVRCMLNLAFAYKDGAFGEEMPSEAYFWFKRAAIRGEPQSQQWVEYLANMVGPAAMMMDQLVDKVERGEMPCPY